MDGQSLPNMKTQVPGPASSAWVDRLAKSECPAITARRSRRAEHGGVPQDPIVWLAAKGANVTDVDGNVYVDLTSAFAVAGVGHTNPRVAAAASQQAATLIHAMGDFYPSSVKIELAEKLADITPGNLTMSIFAMARFEAVEVAIKTATVATGRSTIVAFTGSYHGLGYGALNVTGYRREFREPFLQQLGQFGRHFPYADCYRCPLGLTPSSCGAACLDVLESALVDPGSGLDKPAAVLFEPIQGRGGVVVPPDVWMTRLAALCRSNDLLLIADEIYTGFGRTGRWFAVEHSGVDVDLMCVGKAMGGGFPISAAIGTEQVMNAWGLSAGEALHTSTFLGNPLGCAMALAAIEALEQENMIAASARLGVKFRDWLNQLVEQFTIIGDVRGRGAMIGVELVRDRETKEPADVETLRIVGEMRERGYLVLPAGARGNVISLSPPFVLTDDQRLGFQSAFEEVLKVCQDS